MTSWIWMLAALWAPSAEPFYVTAGAPARPNVAVRWNEYHDYAAATALLKELSARFPNRCALTSLGRSQQGREMWLLRVGQLDPIGGQPVPAFWIDGAIHANEIQATEIVLYTAWYLLESEAQSPFIARLLQERQFYMVPMMSPDSRDAHMHKPNTTHSPRSGQRPVDDDRDGRVDEDGPDDLDGDGHITQMRRLDPAGRFKAHPDFPLLMIPAAPDEKGTHSLLGAEGKDNDGDGLVNEDGDGFYDPNRDWAWNWQPAYVQFGAFRYPFSLKENRVVADFIMAHDNIAGAQSYHNAGGMILRGPGAKDDAYPAADLAVYDAIARRGEKILPGYRYLETATGLYEVYGGELDWFHAMRGVFTFTNELFTPFNFFRKDSKGGFFGRPEEAHEFNKYLLFNDGIVPWHEVDHPQYGKIEVGGLKKNWLRQPPSFLLEEECHRNMAFTLYHADQMPMVKVTALTSRRLPDGLAEISATVENQRLTPTLSSADKKNHITQPDRVSLTGKNIQVLAGVVADNPFYDQSKEQARQPQTLRVDGVPGMGARYVRWIVRGNAPFTVSIHSHKGGYDSMTR